LISNNLLAENMLFLKLFIILLSAVLILTEINGSNKKDIEKETKDVKVIGGRDSVNGKRPYQVALLGDSVLFCGGVLIRTLLLTRKGILM
jgi:hypothetical protein